MEIIIHGKPGSRSSQMSPGLDKVLGNRIVDGFFNSMGNINEARYMVVDAILWDREWYSVYTFELSKGITDIEDRLSYFAISVVLQNQYYCLVSEVYKRLKKVCSNYVIGKYISSKGKYLIPDFEDKLLYDGLVKEINHYTNMLEDFDENFRPVQEPQNNIFYNPIDCDAKAFVQSLRLNGRVIVCESAKAKDSLLGSVDKINSKLQQAQSIIQSKDIEIDRLNKELSAINITLNDAGHKSRKRLNELESGVKALKAENETLKTLNQSYESTINKYRSKFTEIANITKTVEKSKGTQPEKLQSGMKPSALGNRSKLLVVSFINTLLLIFLSILFCAKSCDNENTDNIGKEEYTYTDVSVSDTAVIDNPEPETGNQDMDCGLSIMNVDTNTPLTDGSKIDEGSTILVMIKNDFDNYSIHTDNLKNSNKIKFKEEFQIYPNDRNKPIVISYRSDDINKANQKNKITLYIN